MDRSYTLALVLLVACATPRNPATPQEPEGPEEPEEQTFDSAGPEVLGDNADTVPEVRETDRLCRLDLWCEEPPAFDDPAACTLRVTRQGGDVDWDGPAEVRVRGRSSSQVAKPGYAVELPEPASLLDMGGERDWVIDGLYYDRLLVRDKLGYDLLRDMGHYAPESALCELYLGDVYYGVHALVERLERDDDRIDIADGTETGQAFVLTQNDTEPTR